MAVVSSRQLSPDHAQLDAAVRGVGLDPVFEPIVALPGEQTVGYEALARWPTLNNPCPADVFARAARTGRTHQLDRVCTETAIRSAVSGPMPRGTLVAINCEPLSPYLGCAADDVLARGRDELTLMFELTERSLLTHPHALLAKVGAMRDDGFAIALDDVGANPDSLALLDVLSPDIIKLDLELVQSQPSGAQARTLAAVLAYQERTSAAILAEGIENDEHLEQAMALGATLGQGRKYNYSDPFDASHPETRWLWPRQTRCPTVRSGSPFDLVTNNLVTRPGRKATLSAFSHHIETQADHTADPPMLLTALQHVDDFTPATRERYLRLAQNSPLVAVFGQHLPTDLGGGIRGVHLESGDSLCAEWTVVALGPQLAVALVARERADVGETSGRDEDRRFDFTITYDRSLVTMVANNLLDRML